MKPQEILSREILGALRQATGPERPGWLQTAQAPARQVLESLRFPDRKTENWRYTPLSSLSQFVEGCQLIPDRRPLSHGTSPSTPLTDAPEIIDLDLLLLDGYLVNLPDSLPAGISLSTEENASLAAQAALTESLSQPDPQHPFETVNAGLVDQCLLINVQRQSGRKQIVRLRHASSGDRKLVNPRILLQLESQAELVLIEQFEGSTEHPQWHNPVIDFQLADSAILKHVLVLTEQPQNLHTGRQIVTQAANSRFMQSLLAFGGRLQRRDLQICLEGSGAETRLNGAWLLRERQHFDLHSNVEHLVAHCQSQQTLRGIVTDQAKATFNGRIHIREQAQKSLATMQNNNLLLSSTAEVNTKPELEIYADDVQCAHGATVGQLDKLALHYCESRGIPHQQATRLLARAFIEESLGDEQDTVIQDWLISLIEPYFDGLEVT